MRLTRRTITLSCVLMTAVASAQIRFDSAKAVDPADEIYPLLRSYEDETKKNYAADGTRRPEFSKWIEVDSAAVRQLFPGLRFLSVKWDEEPGPGATTRPTNRAGGLQITLVIDVKARSVITQLAGNGNYTDFGGLLVERKIPLRDDADAKVIWEAFCDIHHKHWKDQTHRRVSDREWRIGIFNVEEFGESDRQFQTMKMQTYYMHVLTEPETHRITAWSLKSETASKRKVPKVRDSATTRAIME